MLLDTHVLLWADADPSRLGNLRDLIADETNDLLVSAVSHGRSRSSTRSADLSYPGSHVSTCPR